MIRRAFLSTAASASQILGANDRVRVGLIGCGGRGQYVAGFMAKHPNCLYTAMADVYDVNAEKAKQALNPQAAVHKEFERILEDPNIDAVHIATPDHWHAIPAILACQAGKHVFVEKPFAHNIREGQAMVKAADANRNRVFMTATQQRSAEHYQEIEQIIQSGQLGAVRFVRVWNYFNMPAMARLLGRGPAEQPANLDWDRYLGPAPKVPYDAARFLGSYRLFWDYSGGWITDYGVHRFDTVHQIMHQDQPKKVSATAHRYGHFEKGELPDVLQATYDYGEFTLAYEAISINAQGASVRTPGLNHYNMRGQFDRPHGEAYFGTKGTIFCDRVSYEVLPEVTGSLGQSGAQPVAGAPQRLAKQAKDATGIHAQHFIQVVLGKEKPRSSALTGHRATNIAHLGNIAMRAGRTLAWDAAKEEFVGDKAAQNLLGRPWRKPWDRFFKA